MAEIPGTPQVHGDHPSGFCTCLMRLLVACLKVCSRESKGPGKRGDGLLLALTQRGVRKPSNQVVGGGGCRVVVVGVGWQQVVGGLWLVGDRGGGVVTGGWWVVVAVVGASSWCLVLVFSPWPLDK